MKDYFADLVLSSETRPVSAISEQPTSQVPIPNPKPISAETMMAEAAIDIVKISIQCFTQYSICLEQERTERARIAAQLEAVTRAIKPKKDSVMEILNQNAQERDRLYTQAETAIQEALRIHDVDMIMKSYNFMLEVYENSPSLNSLKGLF